MDTPTSRDMPRPVATGSDTDYTLSLDDVAACYATAGHPRTLRTLQRYCASGHLDSQKIATATGDKYLVTPQSVERHIAQINELGAIDAVATGRDAPRPVATGRDDAVEPRNGGSVGETEPDVSRQAATGVWESTRYLAQLEKRIDEKDMVIGLLRDELVQRNEEIVRRNERERETNILIRGLQNLVLQLQPGRARPADVFDDDSLMRSSDGPSADQTPASAL